MPKSAAVLIQNMHMVLVASVDRTFFAAFHNTNLPAGFERHGGGHSCSYARSAYGRCHH